MTLRTLVRRDLYTVWRSRFGPTVVLIYGLLLAFFLNSLGTNPTFGDVSRFSVFAEPILGGLALVSSGLSIAGLRESGRIRILLGLPTTRRDVLLGTFLSRAAFLGGLHLTLGTIVVVWTAVYTPTLAGAFAVFFLLQTVYLLGYLSIGVGISVVSSTQRRALTGLLGTFVVVLVFWNTFLPWSAAATVRKILIDAGVSLPSELYTSLAVLSPNNAFFVSLSVIDAVPRELMRFTFDVPVPPTEAAVVVLVAWVVVPLGVGLRVFQSKIEV